MRIANSPFSIDHSFVLPVGCGVTLYHFLSFLKFSLISLIFVDVMTKKLDIDRSFIRLLS